MGTALVLSVVIGYSGYQLWNINQKYAQEAEMHSRLMPYRPTPQVPLAFGSSGSSDAPIINQSIIDLQAKYPDAVGWLTIPNTKIDHSFVQGDNNDYYLHLDLDKSQSPAGTIFMDYRNSKDFSDFNTIIFGHNMRNGSMFGTLQNFNDQNFFDANKIGIIFLAGKTYEIEFIAFAAIQPNDAIIYNPHIATEEDKAAFLSHTKSIARYYRHIDITTNDRVITLSTCNYEFNNARMVLIGRISHYRSPD